MTRAVLLAAAMSPFFTALFIRKCDDGLATDLGYDPTRGGERCLHAQYCIDGTWDEDVCEAVFPNDSEQDFLDDCCEEDAGGIFWDQTNEGCDSSAWIYDISGWRCDDEELEELPPECCGQPRGFESCYDIDDPNDCTRFIAEVYTAPTNPTGCPAGYCTWMGSREECGTQMKVVSINLAPGDDMSKACKDQDNNGCIDGVLTTKVSCDPAPCDTDVYWDPNTLECKPCPVPE